MSQTLAYECFKHIQEYVDSDVHSGISTISNTDENIASVYVAFGKDHQITNRDITCVLAKFVPTLYSVDQK